MSQEKALPALMPRADTTDTDGHDAERGGNALESAANDVENKPLSALVMEAVARGVPPRQIVAALGPLLASEEAKNPERLRAEQERLLQQHKHEVMLQRLAQQGRLQTNLTVLAALLILSTGYFVATGASLYIAVATLSIAGVLCGTLVVIASGGKIRPEDFRTISGGINPSLLLKGTQDASEKEEQSTGGRQ